MIFFFLLFKQLHLILYGFGGTTFFVNGTVRMIYILSNNAVVYFRFPMARRTDIIKTCVSGSFQRG